MSMDIEFLGAEFEGEIEYKTQLETKNMRSYNLSTYSEASTLEVFRGCGRPCQAAAN